MKILGYIFAFIIVCIISALFNGYALSKLWEWFMVSAFGVPSLTVGAAIGVSMVVSFLTHQVSPNDKSEDFGELLAKGIVMAILKPSVALVLGAILKAVL